jgi:uncharacterized membrane protein YeaQ/YmgE (transglycosylase-associated protein family)
VSLLHILSILGIGFVVGVVADIVTLQRVPGGLWGFVGAGCAGAFLSDCLFRFLVVHGLMRYFFYSRGIIVLEQLVGAIFVVTIFNSIKWDYK